MLTLNINNLSVLERQNYLQHAVTPRPICFASTIDKAGNVNLSPFSFFNLFSLNPPICVFSPSRRARDNTTKHTLQNILEVPEVVINMVNYDMVHQASLASVEYPKGVNEFIKAGFTQLPSQMVKPPRVAQSPIQMECTVNRVIPLADTPGAGNLVLAQVVLLHLSEHILDEEGKIDQQKTDLVARLGGDWYCRANNLFKVPKPNQNIGIGIDALPENIRHSPILTGNDLGQLGNVEHLPDAEALAAYRAQNMAILSATNPYQVHRVAKDMLAKGLVNEALMLLLC